MAELFTEDPEFLFGDYLRHEVETPLAQWMGLRPRGGDAFGSMGQEVGMLLAQVNKNIPVWHFTDRDIIVKNTFM